MKKILIIIFILSLCSSCTSTGLSKNSIGNLNVNVSFSSKYNTDIASINGVNMDSALWIGSYNVKYKKDKVILIIKKRLKATGMSGPYLIEFHVPKSATAIYLGSEVIWKT